MSVAGNLTKSMPLLENGDRLTREEFELTWEVYRQKLADRVKEILSSENG